MSKFIKKPVEIEAVQWTGKNEEEIMEFCKDLIPENRDEQRIFLAEDNTLGILTLEGTMTANIGDWIIKGVKGEFYPCKPDIFEASYSPL